jgi:cytoskeletal protein CcmA (bactofilin family)
MSLLKDHSAPHDVSILSSGVRIVGKFSSEGNVRIDGHIEGDVSVTGNLTLGDTSLIKGDISARNITISGKVEGAVFASEKLILESPSELHGDLTAKILVIQEGASFNGKSSMNNSNEQQTE